MGFDTNKLENIRKKIFDRRRSMVTKYSVQKLSDDLKSVFCSREFCDLSQPLVFNFVRIIMRYFGDQNYIDELVTEVFINKLTAKN